MIDYYTVRTLAGNSRKVTILLAETGLEHVVHFVDLDKGEQHEAWFRAIQRDGKIPAIVDSDEPDGLALGESGAILVHLAEKTGRFLPTRAAERARVLQWLFWQVGSVGPMAGQLSYFAERAPEKVPFAIDRYRAECIRLLEVLEAQLAEREYVAGDYSIADIANFCWIKPIYESFVRNGALTAGELAHVPRWIGAVAARPAVAIATTRYEGTAVRVGRGA